jgi:hypothetical protein
MNQVWMHLIWIWIDFEIFFRTHLNCHGAHMSASPVVNPLCAATLPWSGLVTGRGPFPTLYAPPPHSPSRTQTLPSAIATCLEQRWQLTSSLRPNRLVKWMHASPCYSLWAPRPSRPTELIAIPLFPIDVEQCHLRHYIKICRLQWASTSLLPSMDTHQGGMPNGPLFLLLLWLRGLHFTPPSTITAKLADNSLGPGTLDSSSSTSGISGAPWSSGSNGSCSSSPPLTGCCHRIMPSHHLSPSTPFRWDMVVEARLPVLPKPPSSSWAQLSHHHQVGTACCEGTTMVPYRHCRVSARPRLGYQTVPHHGPPWPISPTSVTGLCSAGAMAYGPKLARSTGKIFPLFWILYLIKFPKNHSNFQNS